MPLTQDQASRIWRPTGPKAVVTGLLWSSGGTYTLAQGFDLSLPIYGIRLVFKGRIAVGTANYTSVNPEGILNLIKRILITGNNSRQNGNVTLVDTDLPTAWTMNALFNPSSNVCNINATSIPAPGTPFSTPGTAGLSFFLGTTAGSPYDFIVVCDIPFYPHGLPAVYRPGFGVRQDEWRNSLQLQLQYGVQVDNANGALGVSAATTVTTFTAFGSGAGSPTVDIYALPYQMGPDLQAAVLPGVLSRVNVPIATILQSAGALNTQLAILQPQDTTRVLFKSGASTLNPYFSALNDTNVTTLGVNVGGNRVVRENDDIWAHKQEVMENSGNAVRPPIQGYNMFDFIQSGSPFAAYPGGQIGQGTLFQLVGTVGGLANGYGIIIQEQMIWRPSGALYSDAGQ